MAMFFMQQHKCFHALAIAVVLAVFVLPASAQVLPEDRADALYHSYSGDNVEITGPSILLRKKLTKDFSGYANLYVDSISSASIDVLSYASPYKEKRTEVSVGGDYLLGDTIVSGGYTQSDENDFDARTAYFGVSQDIFGGLTTVRMGYARGWDTVSQVGNPTFEKDVDRRSYRLGVTQVMTKNLLMSLDFEAITDEGFLNNPYRQVRYRYDDPSVPEGYLWEPEVYPNTRTSSAFAVGGRYFVNPGSAIYANARLFDDTWGVGAWNAEAGYIFTARRNWSFDVSYRYYSQTAADFYNDLFDYQDQQNFMGRDKELSTFVSHSFRFDASYDIPVASWGLVERGVASFSYDYMFFDYADFRDVLAGGPVGEEPLFSFSADVFQLYVSFWY